MYCPKCGAQIADGSTFCSSCGTNLAQPPPAYPSYPPYGSAPYNPAYYQQKSGGLAVILAFVLPGAGHIYAGRILRGIAFMAAFFSIGIIIGIGWWATITTGTPGINLLWFSVLMIVISFVIWLFNMVDAYNVTKKYNAELLATGRAPW